MERRAASHTEEEEMNQRRKLLNAAKRGDQKAIGKLFELYQVRVMNPDQLTKINKVYAAMPIPVTFIPTLMPCVECSPFSNATERPSRRVAVGAARARFALVQAEAVSSSLMSPGSRPTCAVTDWSGTAIIFHWSYMTASTSDRFFHVVGSRQLAPFAALIT